MPETEVVMESRSAVPISTAAAAGAVAESRFDILCPNQEEKLEMVGGLKRRHKLAAVEAWCA